ncbi:MAG: MBOAT family protein [bacterium]|nr:MBOAT family protein [bacterium]
MNNIFSADFFVLKIALPLGISFFTFQQVSFIIDSYKGAVPKYNFIDYALFVVFFPQLIAGPIVLHDEIIPQFNNKCNQIFNPENFSKGIYAFAFGLAKKVLIADTMGNAVNLAFKDTDFFLNTSNGIIIMFAYTLQIYFDFSGYCDMSTGLGLMFNIKIPMNFNSPYRALDIVDFWKRWHITLTRFFTKYLYIPLGGNRKGKMRTRLNNFITFLVSGIWHGANWTFILWGSIHGIGIVLNKEFKSKIDKIPKIIRWFITFSFLNVTWLLFRANTVHQFLFIIKRLLSCNFQPLSDEIIEAFISNNLLYIFNGIKFSYLKIIFVFMLFAFVIYASIFMKNTSEKLECFKPNKSNLLVSLTLIFFSIISFSGISTFLYFNF